MQDENLPRFILLDDDGIVLIASAHALKRRYCSQPFDYNFPNALLQGMRDKELVCIGTRGGGSIEVLVEIKSKPDVLKKALTSFSQIGWKIYPPYQLQAESSDSFVILPYSQYTYICDVKNGEIELIEGLGGEVKIADGLYDVHMARNIDPEIIPGEESPSDICLFFFLTPADAERVNDFTHVPGDDGWF